MIRATATVLYARVDTRSDLPTDNALLWHTLCHRESRVRNLESVAKMTVQSLDDVYGIDQGMCLPYAIRATVLLSSSTAVCLAIDEQFVANDASFKRQPTRTDKRSFSPYMPSWAASLAVLMSPNSMNHWTIISYMIRNGPIIIASTSHVNANLQRYMLA